MPASKYRTVSEQFGLEQTAARNTFTTVADGSGEYEIVDSPFHFHLPEQTSAPGPQDEPLHVPELGADTRAVLEEFLRPEEAARLIAAGIAVDDGAHEEGAR